MSSSSPNAMPTQGLALVWAFVGLVAVSHAVIFIRWADDAPALLIATMRVAIATAVFLPIAARGIVRRAPPDWTAIALSGLAGVFLALHFGAWIDSVQRLTIAESAILVSLSPVWLVAADILLGRGWPDRRTIFGIVLCLIGMSILGWDGLMRPSGDPVGLALALIGGLAMAGYLAIGRSVRSRLPTSQYVTVCYGAAAAVLAAVALAMGIQFTGYSTEIWIAIIALGAISQVVGHTAYNFALIRLSPVFASICLLGEPIFGSVLGIVYLGEPIPTATLIGGAPILIGLWLAIQGELKRPPRR